MSYYSFHKDELGRFGFMDDYGNWVRCDFKKMVRTVAAGYM